MSLRRLVTPIALGAVLLVSGGCGLVGATGFVPPEMSGWKAHPQEADQAILDAAQRDCVELAFGAGAEPDWIIVDQRGPDAAAIQWTMPDGGSGSCFIGRIAGGPLGAQGPVAGVAVTTGTSNLGAFGMTGESYGEPTIAWGVVPTPRLEIVTDSGRKLRATVKDGRWLAWWPADECVIDITAIDADGGSHLAMEPMPRLLHRC